MATEFDYRELNTNGTTVNQCYVVGDDVDEIVAEVIRSVRPQSKDFYRCELRKDLEERGHSHVDVHAGNGVRYSVYVKGHTDELVAA